MRGYVGWLCGVMFLGTGAFAADTTAPGAAAVADQAAPAGTTATAAKPAAPAANSAGTSVPAAAATPEKSPAAGKGDAVPAASGQTDSKNPAATGAETPGKNNQTEAEKAQKKAARDAEAAEIARKKAAEAAAKAEELTKKKAAEAAAKAEESARKKAAEAAAKAEELTKKKAAEAAAKAEESARKKAAAVAKAEENAKKKAERDASAAATAATAAPVVAVSEPAQPQEPQWAASYPTGLKRFYGRFLQFDSDDALDMPKEGGAVFFGSSSITMWNQIPADFADIRAINRGFGGAQTGEWVMLFDRYVVRYGPKYVVFYCGENDIAGKKTAEDVAKNLSRIFWAIHIALPEAKLYFLSLKPAPSRVKFWPEMQRANELCRRFCDGQDWATYVDIVPPMLTADGKPRPELFLKDMLHMNREAYETIWIPALRKAMGLQPLPVPAAAAVNAKAGAKK